MGWSRGSILANDVWQVVKPAISPIQQGECALEIYNLFCDEDADDWDGSSTLEKDAGVNQDG